MRVLTILFAMMLMSLGTAQAQTQSGDEASEEMAEPAPPAEQGTAQEQTGAVGEQSGFSRGSVVRSVFTTGIDDREPVDTVDELDTGHRSVYYFTELQDMSGQTATHRWVYNDKVMAEVEFQVNGPRWRVWSKKTFVPGWTGQWTVSVLNGAGEVISEDVFEYTEPAPAAEPEPAEDGGEAMQSPAGSDDETATSPAAAPMD